MKKERILLDSGATPFMIRFEVTKTLYMTRTRIKWQHSSNVGEKIWMKENVFVYKRKLEFTQVSMIDMVLRPYRILILSALWFPFMIKQTIYLTKHANGFQILANLFISIAKIRWFKSGIARECMLRVETSHFHVIPYLKVFILNFIKMFQLFVHACF